MSDLTFSSFDLFSLTWFYLPVCTQHRKSDDAFQLHMHERKTCNFLSARRSICMDHNGAKSIRIFSSGKKPIILTREDKKRNAKKRQQLTKAGQTCPEEHSFQVLTRQK